MKSDISPLEAADILQRHHIGALSPGTGMALLKVANEVEAAAEAETDERVRAFLIDYEVTMRRLAVIAAFHQRLVIDALEALIRQGRE